MTTPMKLLLVSLAAYLIGSIPFGYLIGRMKGIDIRQHGSHNIGATNVTRVLGRTTGRYCFFCDLLKGYLPVLLLPGLAENSWAPVCVAAGTVLGHIFPCWLQFKGGKGVATCLGALLALSWLPVLLGAVSWVLCFYRTRVVAIASIIAVVVIPVAGLVLRLLKWGGAPSRPVVWTMILAAVLVIIRHRDNLKRLREGQELSFKP